jgi:hypothetical protein
MGDVINLRIVRKRKGRDEAEAEAATNRAKFGRTKAEKKQDEQKAAQLARAVDQAKLDAKFDE